MIQLLLASSIPASFFFLFLGAHPRQANQQDLLRSGFHLRGLYRCLTWHGAREDDWNDRVSRVKSPYSHSRTRAVCGQLISHQRRTREENRTNGRTPTNALAVCHSALRKYPPPPSPMTDKSSFCLSSSKRPAAGAGARHTYRGRGKGPTGTRRMLSPLGKDYIHPAGDMSPGVNQASSLRVPVSVHNHSKKLGAVRALSCFFIAPFCFV